jgi:ATP-binding cassette subfamily A (ABC1) protein 3
LISGYSGGTKRKLSTAIALVGGPPLVFLDEPTTGMDPVARRHLWNALTNHRSKGKTLLLTSHSMEECEALCTRLAIMVNGEFKCLGTGQHLKGKFGNGYTLLAKTSPNTDDGIMVEQFVAKHFPSSELKDAHQGLLHFHLQSSEEAPLSWGRVFGLLESNKSALRLVDYSVSQTTLEQVFLGFARAQRPPVECKKSVWVKLCPCCTCCSAKVPPSE